MTRPIKFRAIAKVNHDSNPKFEFTLEEIMRGQVSIGYPEHWNFNQFTGLTDKNGKEIYEGDIVSWKTVEGKDEIGEISWNDARAEYTIDFKKDGRYGFTKDEANIRFEVIGNIYENPELLK